MKGLVIATGPIDVFQTLVGTGGIQALKNSIDVIGGRSAIVLTLVC